MRKEEVLTEVEAVLTMYGDDCVILDSFPPQLHLHIKPRTVDFVKAVIGIRAGPQYPSEPLQIDLIESKGLDGEKKKQLITIEELVSQSLLFLGYEHTFELSASAMIDCYLHPFCFICFNGHDMLAPFSAAGLWCTALVLRLLSLQSLAYNYEVDFI
ncbi:unnamed protein product [Dovyalis caffra]|uniref:RWD domain-containing protein n=1 Tax=Dovyalis caffra TaxID=77055 RepID=A0AAV1RUE1_9ROSI|nr:unnamed protein product [Dovyalis caffra]